MSALASLLNRIVALPTGQVVAGSLLAPNKLYCFRLLWMVKNDQREHQAFMNGRPWDDQISRRNAQTMKNIIAQSGWPGEKLVGQMGAQAAWLVVQHADHDLAFQKECHRLLERR